MHFSLKNDLTSLKELFKILRDEGPVLKGVLCAGYRQPDMRACQLVPMGRDQLNIIRRLTPAPRPWPKWRETPLCRRELQWLQRATTSAI